MCGIVGCFHYARSQPVSKEVLQRQRDVLRHRGPDDAGIWLAADGTIGLAHRRLSIVDLSPDGRQPMTNETGSIWLTFNGEIYNHASKRPWLMDRGHKLRSQSDTEVILHLYEEFGPACVEHLDGMFAFALWDHETRQLLMARDRLGVKPLYYLQQDGMLLFASEIKALLAHPEVPRTLDREALGYYLTLKTVPAPRTLLAGIRKLEAGHTLVVDRHGNIQSRRYWDVVAPGHQLNREVDVGTATERVRFLLNQSVQKRMMSDVPLGVFLSGGLDSSAIVGLMAPLVRQPINTFSVAIGDVPGHNELDYARLVAKRFATNHREILIGYRELVDYLPDLVYYQDEPLADPVCVPLYYLSRLARDSGVKVVLVGEGSDEQFLGYDSRIGFLRRFRRTWAPLLALPRGVRQGLDRAASAFERNTGFGRRPARVLAKAAREQELFLGSQAFGGEAMEQLVTPDSTDLLGQAADRVQEICRPLRQVWPAADIASLMIYVDLKIRISELLLMRIDKVTMSVGVEAREPFLDYQLAEYLMTIPRRLKLRGWQAKYLLKRAVLDVVPPEIVRRRKQAFSAPVADWLRQGLEEFARQAVFHSRLRELNLFRYDVVEHMFAEHCAGKENHDVRLWNLINLSAWYDRMFP